MKYTSDCQKKVIKQNVKSVVKVPHVNECKMDLYELNLTKF